MTGDSHRDDLGNSCAHEIADPASAQIVNQELGQPDLGACGRPCFAEISNLLSIAMKDERAIDFALRSRALNQCEQVARER